MRFERRNECFSLNCQRFHLIENNFNFHVWSDQVDGLIDHGWRAVFTSMVHRDDLEIIRVLLDSSERFLNVGLNSPPGGVWDFACEVVEINTAFGAVNRRFEIRQEPIFC